MKIRRTLEKVQARDLKPSELKVRLCVVLTDSDENTDAVFVYRISDNEILFTSGLRDVDSGILLSREGETLRDEKGREVKIWGKPTQEDREGNPI